MALWDIAARILTQLASSSIGLAIKRFSSGATGDLQQWQNESGTALASVNSAGTVNASNSAVVIQKDLNTIGLLVKRGASSVNSDLLAVQDETSAYLTGVRPDGSMYVNGYTSWTQFPGLGRVEWILNGMDAGAELRIWNGNAGYFHWRAYTDRMELAAIIVGAAGSINRYNSLTALKIAGLATTSGKPTASTWVAGDSFVDSKGVPQLCTTGGTPGTWVSGGWQLAGFYKFASALATSGAITVATFDELMIVIRMPSMSAGTDVPALQFNSDTGSNYSYSSMMGSATAATATLTASGLANTTQANLSGNVGAFQRTITVIVSNKLAAAKTGSVVAANGSGAAATLSVRDVSGQFEWVNTAAQITSVTMKSSGGTVTFPIDSGFQVFGRDFA